MNCEGEKRKRNSTLLCYNVLKAVYRRASPFRLWIALRRRLNLLAVAFDRLAAALAFIVSTPAQKPSTLLASRFLARY
jgi:hypothetical protein